MTDFGLLDYDGSNAVFGAQAATAPSGVYVLAPFVAAPPSSLTLAELWARPGPWALIARSGAWDFTVEAPSDAAKTLKLAGIGTGAIVAWRADPALSASWWQGAPPAPIYQSLIVDPVGGTARQIRGNVILGLGNVTLAVSAGTTVKLGGDSLDFDVGTNPQFKINRSDAKMQDLVFGQASLLTAASGAFAAGGLLATASFRPRSLFLLGQDASQMTASAVGAPDLRYWRDIGAASAQRIRLPLFAPVDVSAPQVKLSFALNPALPFDPAATRFDLDPASYGCLANAAPLITREGAAVGLTPATGIGFHLGLAPGKSSAYLAPYGRYTLAGPGGGGGSFKLMPGLSGLERIEANPGDLIELVPAQPAFGTASALGLADGPGQPPQLTSACTTSWARLIPAAGRRYFAQPLASVFYASADGTTLPRAADALVASLTGAEAPYPLAPYGNAYKPGINDPTPAAAIADFEHVYLSGARGKILGSQNPPVFSLDGVALGSKGATPRGLMADIGPGPPAPAAFLPTRRPRPKRSAAVVATPAGQWQRLYLAQGVTSAVRLDPNDNGIVDPVIANALMQPDLFLVYNNWDKHDIKSVGELDVGGFSFDWAPLDHDTACQKKKMLIVAKFTTKVSLQDLFSMPERWRDADALVAPGEDSAPDIACAQQVFTDAMTVARAAPPPLFNDFLNRIATSPAWTGIVVFGAAVDGNNMPPTLQILMAGMSQPLRAHHLAVDVTMLQAKGGVPSNIGPSSVAGVISYDADSTVSPAGSDDYGFYTKSLKVGIYGSAVTSFNAEVGIAANLFFGRPVALERVEGDPVFANTFLLRGIYHLIAGVPTVTFVLPAPRVFEFPAGDSLQGGGFDRILSRFEIDMAGILPQLPPTVDKEGNVTHRAQITLSGSLSFDPDPFKVGVDLFSYGVDGMGGVGLSNFSLEMAFVLDAQGQPLVPPQPPTLQVDYSRLAVAERAGTIRPGALLSGLPLKLKGILADDKGLDTAKLGGKPVNVLQIAGRETQKPHFALQFELLIGSLGELSGVHAGLAAEMRLAWGPRATIADADGALLTIQLPGASGGFKDLNVQGMLALVFGDANLMQVPYTDGDGKTTNVFVVLFNNVALSVMGIKLPPKVVSDLILFSDPARASGSSLAACLAVQQT